MRHNVGRLYEGIIKIRYMEELIKLKTFCELEIEKANGKLYSNEPPIYLSTEIQLHERVEAFSEVIERLDLILNNSVVKPPDERQNPQEEKSECSEDCHNSAIKLGLTSCLICNDRL